MGDELRTNLLCADVRDPPISINEKLNRKILKKTHFVIPEEGWGLVFSTNFLTVENSTSKYLFSLWKIVLSDTNPRIIPD